MKSINFVLLRKKNNVLFLVLLMFFTTLTIQSQRTIRIGYIDTEYILENVPEYEQANSQLDTKVQQWKGEIEERLSQLEEKRKVLNNERVLLTKELIEERQEELQIEESEILDYQQKRFGPNGDMMIQKKQLMQPIQDQIFTAVQEIASTRNYDFVFDKSADVVMLYSADRFDISDQVLRTITRSSNRRQAENRAERKEAEDEELIPEINTEQEARAKALEDKKAERERTIEERRQQQVEARDAKRKAVEDKKKKILEDRAKAREEKLNARNNTTENESDTGEKALTPAQAKRKAIEDKKKKILEDRAKAREEKLNARKNTTENKGEVKNDSVSTKSVTPPGTAAEKTDEAKPKTTAELIKERQQKKIQDREARKKALEEKKKKILDARRKKLEERKKKTDSIAAKKQD